MPVSDGSVQGCFCSIGQQNSNRGRACLLRIAGEELRALATTMKCQDKDLIIIFRKIKNHARLII